MVGSVIEQEDVGLGINVPVIKDWKLNEDIRHLGLNVK